MPEPLCLVSGDGRILACNPPAASLLGLTGDARNNHSIFDLTADPADKVKRFLRTCSRSREMCIGALTLRTSSGEISIYRCEGAVLKPRSDSVPSILLLRFRPRESASSRFLLLNEKIDALGREIRERRRAEEEAWAQREHFRVTLTSIGDAVIATDAQGAVTFINAAAQKLTGWGLEEALGRPLTEIFHVINEQTREKVENPVSKVIREGTTVGLANHTILISRDGTERPIDDSGAPIRDESGGIIGTVLVFQDITERRQAEETLRNLLEREQIARYRAEEASRLKDEFLATVSHELRTPLNAILGWTRLLRGGNLDAATTARALETIERNAVSQNALIEDILDVSRIITGSFRLEFQTLDVLPLIEAAIDSVRLAAEAKGVTIESALDSEAGAISGDPQRIQQIIWNLLSNAIKFTPTGGRIEVRLERRDSQIEITVSDTGIGIEPDFLPFVFDRFRQADSSAARYYGGLGLGLAIVRHLVELHGGMVSAESAGANQGATFRVSLPPAVQRPELSTLQSTSRIAESSEFFDLSIDLAGLRVLVVDDEEAVRDLLAVALVQRGADVRAAASSAEALSVIDEWPPAVIVSDIGMPYEDGYTFIRKVRARGAARGGQTPAVALTAYAKAEDRLRALSAGYQVHVAKPVDPMELMAVIASLTGRLGH